MLHYTVIELTFSVSRIGKSPSGLVKALGIMAGIEKPGTNSTTTTD